MNSSQLVLTPLPARVDERGMLIVVEGGISLPFDIARVFYLVGSPADIALVSNALRRFNAGWPR